jgi:hypothetical protein
MDTQTTSPPRQNAEGGLPEATCSRLRCEECNVELPASREDNPHMTAAKAKNAGVWVKNFIIYGDDSGYHYFCCADHGKAWWEKNIPSANSMIEPRAAFAGDEQHNQTKP